MNPRHQKQQFDGWLLQFLFYEKYNMSSFLYTFYKTLQGVSILFFYDSGISREFGLSYSESKETLKIMFLIFEIIAESNSQKEEYIC